MCRKSRVFNFLILTAFCHLLACTRQETVRISGSANRLEGSAVNILSESSALLAETRIQNGLFDLKASLEPGFYTFCISPPHSADPYYYPLYLENGSYTLNLDSSALERYPAIKTGSVYQRQLSELKQLGNDPEAKRQFVKKYPNSPVAAYTIRTIVADSVEYFPEKHLAVYNLLGEGAKKTHYAVGYKKIIDRYMSGRVGSELPYLSGRLPNGSSFKRSSLKGKLSLVIFWRSLNMDTRKRGELDGLAELHRAYRHQGFEVVAVSFDSSKERWQKYLADHRFNWINLHDEKGIRSSNIKRFGNTSLPYYFLVGPDLKIVERNPPAESIEIYIKEFMERP